MVRLRRRFFLWLGDQIVYAAEERGAARRALANAWMLRPAGQKWFSSYASGITWVDGDYDEHVGPPIKPLKPDEPVDA